MQGWWRSFGYVLVLPRDKLALKPIRRPLANLEFQRQGSLSAPITMEHQYLLAILNATEPSWDFSPVRHLLTISR